MLKITLFCFLLAIVCIQGHVINKRDVSSSPTNQPNVLDNFQKNLMSFRMCVDQSLANVVSDVNVKHLQPVLSVVGDSANRISKAFEDLTAPTKTAKQDSFDDSL